MVMLLPYRNGDGRHDLSVDIDVTSVPSRREALVDVSRPVAGVHERAKRIRPELVAKALDNEPFEDYPRADYAWRRVRDEAGEAKERFNQSYGKAVESFLRRTYHSLTFIPQISFDIENISESNERKGLDAAIQSLRAASVGRQVDALGEAYTGLCALRKVFASSGQNDNFSIETVVSSRYLSELVVIAPVWFFAVKGGQWADSSTVEYFCDLCPTDQFAWLFQMYNDQPRSFNELEGRDVIPLPIAKLAGEVKNLFDYLVIATPYHDLASIKWQGKTWAPNIDPFLFGFLKQIPELMFFLGRWSGTGLFPLVGDMIADTIEHIRNNKRVLSNFSKKTVWYRGGREASRFRELPYIGETDRFVNNVLRHFERGTLFPWLRGESQ